MPAEPHALSKVPPPEPPADADYDAICSAVTATARGRWFLEEYAKRNRNSDTMQVLAAIAEMRTAVVGERMQQASREAHQEVQIELLEMARTIAQARAEVAESQPAAVQPAPGAVPEPDVAAAADRLRQIAWTIRACGIELPAAEQIGEIANAILSADALRGLGAQRAQKLTEALHHLEHRIERMLDGHRAAAADTRHAEPGANVVSPKADDGGRESAPVTLAVAMIAAALRPDTEETDAPPAAAPSPAAAETTATSMAQGALAASDAADYPLDEDVVLTVTDSVIEPPADAMQAARIELELEPLTPAKPTAKDGEAEFTGLELEPLAVVPPVAAVPAVEAPAAAEAALVAVAQPAIEVPPAIEAPAAIEATLNAPPPAQPAAATAEPVATQDDKQDEKLDAEPDAADSEANDNLPMMLAAQAGTTTATDAIAMQVDQDLDGLADPVPDEIIGTAATAPQPAIAPAGRAQVATEDDPAGSLLEAAPHKAPVSALVASSQAARAQLSDTLAAIENELFGSTRPDARTDPQPSTAIPATAKSAAAAGPLAALMAMREEERIALFS